MNPRRTFFPDRTLGWAFAALVLAFVFFEYTGADVWLQDRLFNFETGRWWVGDRAPVPRFFFYDLPKVLIIALAVALIVLAAGPAGWRAGLWQGVRRADLWIVVATLASGPGLIAIGKASTNVFGPRELRRYGGFAPYVRVLEKIPPDQRSKRRGRCFPAGHASGGYALASLSGLARTRRGRLVGASVGVVVGSIIGAYQMARGAHFLSHTVVAALLCWIIFLLWRRLLGGADPVWKESLA